MTLVYRQCYTTEEYAQVAKLEQTIWQMGAADAITPHGQHVLTHTGGSVWGAFETDDRMVGMAVAFAMRERHQVWSHMTGVHPEYQGQGIGYQLKQVQRDWALAQGYTHMHWTFDPAMRRNAHFNMQMLGARANLYHANFYGTMSDGINAGVPSDRLEAVWHLEATVDTRPAPENPAEIATLLSHDADIINTATQVIHKIAIPYDFVALKQADNMLALKWRASMQRVMQDAFKAGYQIVDCVVEREKQQAWYVIERM
ncbi:MAG: GNAT family N-acetyltransferase [Chloroflexota bacterium]